ncbi:MAG: hypothetical protein AB1425_07845 [Actinomycetota bacterium]
MPSPPTPDPETRALWHELARLYAAVAGSGRRATRLGFVVLCGAGALVLLSAPLFGTAWAGPFAAVIPVAAGLLAGGGAHLRERARLRRRLSEVGGALEARGADPDRPTKDGLGAYTDEHLILLRSRYELLRLRGAKRSARLFEETFGFLEEDPFETGPLNATPGTEKMRLLRERWERRISSRRQREIEPPALSPREDALYEIFPRGGGETELEARLGYLEISRNLIRERYGGKGVKVPEEIRERVARDLREYEALAGEISRREARRR